MWEERSSRNLRPHQARRRFFRRGARWQFESLDARNAGRPIRSTPASSASSASGRSRSPMTTPDLDPAEARRKIQAGSRGHLALLGLPALRRAARRPARAGPDAADPRRPPRRAARPGRALDQERRRQPDALLQGPRRRRRDRQGQGARLRDRRLRLDRQPRQRRRRPRGRRRASSPTSSCPPTSRSRSCSRPASTEPTWSASAAPTTTSTGSARSSARPTPGPSSTSTCARTTPRARRRWPSRRSSSSAGTFPTASSRRSPRARCSPRSPRA